MEDAVLGKAFANWRNWILHTLLMMGGLDGGLGVGLRD